MACIAPQNVLDESGIRVEQCGHICAPPIGLLCDIIHLQLGLSSSGDCSLLASNLASVLGWWHTSQLRTRLPAPCWLG